MVLTDKNDIKNVKNFVKTIKENAVDYTKINEIIKNNIDGDCEFFTWSDEQLCCCNVNYEDLYNLINYILLLGKRYYTGINNGDMEYSYQNNRGNTTTITVDVSLRNVTMLFQKAHKYKTIIAYKYDSGYKSPKDGWAGDAALTNFELELHVNKIPVILHCKKMVFYTTSRNTSGGSHWSDYGYSLRTKYHIYFDETYIHQILEYGDYSDYLWLTMGGDTLPYATYCVSKEDILHACEQTNKVVKELNALNSKLIKEDFIVDLNDRIENLKIESDFITNSKGEIIKEIVFKTNNSVPEIESGIKFITIYMEQDDEYMYRFNGSIGKESLSYHRPIKTDLDIKESLDATLGMITYSKVLNKYSKDLLEIKNSL